MARIPYVQKDTAPPEVKELYENFAGQFNLRDVPNVVKALANSPTLARHAGKARSPRSSSTRAPSFCRRSWANASIAAEPSTPVRLASG